MRSRWIRLAIGIGVLAVGVLLLAPYTLHAISRQAIVTAPVLDVASPIDGALRLDIREGDAIIAAGEVLGSVVNDRLDRSRLFEVASELARLDAEIIALRNDVISLRAQIGLHQGQMQAYADARLAQLRAEAEAAGALVEEARARAVERNAEAARMVALAERQIAARANVERVQAEARAASAAERAAQQRLEAVRVALAAAETGTFIGDSYNDQPYSAQRLDQLRVRVAEIDNEIRLRQVQRRSLVRLRDEMEEMARLRGEATLVAPVSGRLWNVELGPGSFVREGQRVVRLLDCGRTVVVANVSEGDYNALRIGDRASFRANGSSDRLDARIVGLAGAGSYREDLNYAIPPRATESDDFIVYIHVPDLDRTCPVGRTGRVRFAQENTIGRRASSLVRGILDRLP